MRRTVSALFSFIMIILTLSACGSHVQSDNSKEIDIVETEQPEKEQSIIIQETEDQSSELKGTVQVIEDEIPESDSLDKQEADVNTKILVAYFSCTGSTELVAEYVTEILEADVYEIVPEDPYTEADLAYYTNGRADQEQNDPNVRPQISGNLENIDEYDTIILGYPIWHGQAPRIISTFLENYDFSGKTIIPFCTSHSSGIGSSASDLHALCSESVVWMDGKRFEAGTSKESVQNWLVEAGLLAQYERSGQKSARSFLWTR